jgi:hypothetical protein
MADALALVMRALRERYGNNPDRWSWGRIRPLTLRHSAGERAPLDRVFNLDRFTPGVAMPIPSAKRMLVPANLQPIHPISLRSGWSLMWETGMIADSSCPEDSLATPYRLTMAISFPSGNAARECPSPGLGRRWIRRFARSCA